MFIIPFAGAAVKMLTIDGVPIVHIAAAGVAVG
jgi:hypothetical protein